MAKNSDNTRRVKYYGPNDLAAGNHAVRALELLNAPEGFAPTSATDAVELYNVKLYLDAGLRIPDSGTPGSSRVTLAKSLMSAVFRFFASIDESNIAAIMAETPFEYRGDLLDLLGMSDFYVRCDAQTTLDALFAAGVPLSQLLGCKKLVQEYNCQLRELMLAEPKSAELLVQKHLRAEGGERLYVPSSLSASDAHDLLARYVDDANAHLNVVELISRAHGAPELGIDGKLKLKAKRRGEELLTSLFEQQPGVEIGVEVSVSRSQHQSHLETQDGMTARYSYSAQWLEETLDYPSVLNNFVHLFGFVDSQGVLTLPSYPYEMGTLERLVGVKGRRDYQRGTAFHLKDSASLLQVNMYKGFLADRDVEIENVVQWFFATYLPEEFNAEGFNFTPSSMGSTYLERARHLFSEMEGLVNQFRLYARDGSIDRDLLAIETDAVAFSDIPSLLARKYVHAPASSDIHSVLHMLFSDQSTLKYINDELNADSLPELLGANKVLHEDFHDYQQPAIDYLVSIGVLARTESRVQVAYPGRLALLKSLYRVQAALPRRLPASGRDYALQLESSGWIEMSATLLTRAEASYFNFFLNKTEFSDGPELRNKYLHGSQALPTSESEHVYAYIVAVRLIVALAIKINDEFCLLDAEREAPVDD